jgi:hypothetical protein
VTKRKKADLGEGLIEKGQTDRLEIEQREDEPMGRTIARVALNPLARHATLAGGFASQFFGDGQRPNVTETVAALGEEVAKASGGDLIGEPHPLFTGCVAGRAVYRDGSKRRRIAVPR